MSDHAIERSTSCKYAANQKTVSIEKTNEQFVFKAKTEENITTREMNELLKTSIKTAILLLPETGGELTLSDIAKKHIGNKENENFLTDLLTSINEPHQKNSIILKLTE